MLVQIISMLSMQVMVDLVMDLLDRIVSKAASILELEGKETLMVDEIHTGARLVLLDCKDGVNACRPLLDLNLVRYATLSIHELDCRDASACCYGVRRPPWSVHAGVICT
jgi:hypothetical protein